MVSSVSRDCAVIISTCDNYSDIWDPFFMLFNKFWPDNPYPVFLNSETLDFSNDNIQVTTLKARTACLSWTRRLKEAIERIEAEYILFMLDDFLLYDYVDTTRIENCVTFLRRDPDIGAIYFSSLSYQMEDCDLPELEKCKHTGKSKVNLTLALWRREAFLYYLNHDETAWEFEANSLERSLERRDTFYSYSKSARIVIPYDYVRYGLFAGKWFKPTVDLFAKHGIAHDFSARGFYEEYEYGLIPYVARQIKMDSYLVPCYSLTRDNPRINTDKIVEEGYFTQRYDVSGAQNAAIWYPSSIPGYAIENFKCKITFLSGEEKILGHKEVFGSFALNHNIMYFLSWGVFVYILLDTKKEMSCITFEGYMNKNLSRNDLAAAYSMEPKVVPTGLKELHDVSRIYAETLLLPQNFTSFRIYSKICFKQNSRYDEKKAIIDGKDRFPGYFLQSYKIIKSVGKIVRWDIGGSFGGFAIEGLQIEVIFNDEVSKLLEHKNIKGDGIFVDGYWVFLSTNAHLLFSLPGKNPDEIRISGTLLAPMPRTVLRAVIFADDLASDVNKGSENQTRNSLINVNGLRFVMSIIKRGIKKYGLIGVVKELIRRTLRR